MIDWEKIKKVEPESVPEFGSLFVIDEFIEFCKCTGFIDDDGHGDLATKAQIWETPGFLAGIKPSEIMADIDDFRQRCAELGATHMCWYNR